MSHFYPETPPRMPRNAADVISRPRLLDTLDQVLDGPGMVLVSAPAGYGKTMLLVDWLGRLAARRPDVRAAWYTVEPADNDPRRFLAMLVGAVRAAAPDALPQTTALLREAVTIDPEAVLFEAVREASLLPGPLVLVIDDFHLIHSPVILELSRLIVPYRPSQVRLVIVARRDPPLGLSRLRANNELIEIRAAQLAFRPQETRQMLAQSLDGPLADETAAALHDLTEGWPVGLRLSIVAMREADRRQDVVEQLRHSSHRFIAEYLLDEVLGGLPAEILHFLLWTSPLDRLNPELCAAALGTNDSAAARDMLETLEQQNLFIVPLQGGGGWHRYQRQLQSLLRQRLALRATADEQANIHRRAADWYAARDLLEDATGHYLAAHDADCAAQAIGRETVGLQNRDQWALLRRLLDRLPRETIDHYPQLILARVWSGLMTLDTDRMPELLARAETLLRDRGIDEVDYPAIWGEIHTLRGSMLNLGPTADERRASLLRALELVPRSHSWTRAYAFAGLVYAMGAPQQIPVIEQMIRDELDQPGVEGTYRIRLLQALGLIYFRSGTLDAYEATCHQYICLSEENGQASSAAYGHFGVGIARFHRGESATALPELEAALANPGLVGREMLYSVQYPLLTVYAETGQPERIEPALAAADRILAPGPNREEWHALEAFAALLLGRSMEARRWADETEHTPAGMPVEARALVLARIRLAQPDAAGLAQADALLAPYIEALAAEGEGRQRLQALVLRARVAWLRGRPEAALDWLEQALALGYERGYRRWFLEPGPELGEMLAALIRAGRQAEAARQVRLARPRTELQSVGELSARELDLLRLLGQGLSNKEIAAGLMISPNTVRNQLSTLFAKLGVSARADAVSEARRLGWIE